MAQDCPEASPILMDFIHQNLLNHILHIIRETKAKRQDQIVDI